MRLHGVVVGMGSRSEQSEQLGLLRNFGLIIVCMAETACSVEFDVRNFAEAKLV